MQRQIRIKDQVFTKARKRVQGAGILTNKSINLIIIIKIRFILTAPYTFSGLLKFKLGSADPLFICFTEGSEEGFNQNRNLRIKILFSLLEMFLIFSLPL